MKTSFSAMRRSCSVPLALLLAVPALLPLGGCTTTAPEKPPVIQVAAEPADPNRPRMQQAHGGANGSTDSALAHQSYSITNQRGIDTDKDGFLDDTDRCPDEPEDRDGFKDNDGCPEPDNDADGVLDARDHCPNDPETKNGIQDNDGCPDEITDRAKFAVRIGGIAFVQGDYATACKYYEEAYNLDPQDELLLNLAICFEKVNNHLVACNFYKQWRASPVATKSPPPLPALDTCP